jgi:hypothetical protein
MPLAHMPPLPHPAAALPSAAQVNKYPAQRVFSAIGSGEDSFKAAMVAAVESVVGMVHQECITTTPSKGEPYHIRAPGTTPGTVGSGLAAATHSIP